MDFQTFFSAEGISEQALTVVFDPIGGEGIRKEQARIPLSALLERIVIKSG